MTPGGSGEHGATRVVDRAKQELLTTEAKKDFLATEHTESTEAKVASHLWELWALCGEGRMRSRGLTGKQLSKLSKLSPRRQKDL